MLSSAPTSGLTLAASTALLHVAPEALALLHPTYSLDNGELSDFGFDYLNPAGLRLLAAANRPATTLLSAFAGAQQGGLLAYCRQVFAADEAAGPTLTYLPGPPEQYFPLAAQRHGDQLALTFTTLGQESGPTVGSSLVACDATAQVLARQVREAQQHQLQLQRLFMQAPAAVCILAGPQLVFELVNPGYQQLFPGRPLLGQPLLEALPEIASHAVVDTFRQVFATGTTHHEREMLIPLLCPQRGELVDRYFNYMQQARLNEQGQIDGVLVFAFEVTKEVHARQQVQHLNEELLATNQELATTNEQLTRTNVDLDSFIYTASHDLKEPVTNLDGLVAALREVLPPAAAQVELVQTLLGMMEGAVARFQLTLAQLTDVASLQHTATHPTENVDLATLVATVLQDFSPTLLADAHLTVEVKACPNVFFAPQHLRSVVYNLLSNALKYRDPQRALVVQLRCRREQATAVLEVQDNGLGLDPAQQSRLFGMFQRLHPHVAGAGMGLYIVKKIVENVGGTVRVQSVSGVGSTFTVTLPAAG